MRSAGGSEPLDLGRIETTPADVAALRRARQSRAPTTAELLRALEQLLPSREALRRRKGPAGPEPFRL
jgi:hypothetical protein